MMRCELLAPAGNLEKLKIAITYGADAVYFGAKEFSLRAKAGNFTTKEMEYAINYSRARGVKTYITVNIFARNNDLKDIRNFLGFLNELSPDGIIVSDPGIISICRKEFPNLSLHLSTQANTLNLESVKFWRNFGIKRVNLARELSFEEIKQIRMSVPDIELEVFVHGALCIAYSGRCMLSLYMTGREANRGMCAHPCRYSYSLVEEKRPGQFFPIEEDSRGVYIFNSKDLCLIRRIDCLVELGIDSLKIEGRIKGKLYVASVVRAYRQAIDAAILHKEIDMDRLLKELEDIASRGYTENFFSRVPKAEDMNYTDKIVPQPYIPVAVIEKISNDAIICRANHCISPGDELEYMAPDMNDKRFTVIALETYPDGQPLEKTLGGELFVMKIKPNIEVKEYAIIRRATD